MGLFSKFKESLQLKDEDYDDDEFFDDDDELEEEGEKKGFFSRFFKKKSDYDDEDDYYDEPDEKPARKSQPSYEEEPKARFANNPAPAQKVTPIKRRSPANMTVRVIKPNSMEDTSVIADTLLANCTVVLNLEGMDVEVAQRVTDFCSGSCYSINGAIQKVSSFIFILTPAGVGITGDITDILYGNEARSAY